MPSPETPRTLFEKLWQTNEVRAAEGDVPAMLYIDLHLVHEVTSPQGFDVLRARGIGVRRPERTLATLDHSTPTTPPDDAGKLHYVTDQARRQVEALERNCHEFGIELQGWGSRHRGIVHVMAPEIGATQPGMTVVCGDSHTSTHGAFGALAFGIGTTEVGYVLATQCLLQRKPKTMRITFDGRLGEGVTAKDMALHTIRTIGVDGGTGYVIEYAGDAVRALDMEGRMTLCNMTIEAGARAGMIAADNVTVEYLRGRERSPTGAAFDSAADQWLTFRSDPGARFDREISINAADIQPTITWGTDPGMSASLDSHLPAPGSAGVNRALAYMGLEAGQAVGGHPIDVVFIGSCTNGRIADLRSAAAIMNGRRVAPHVRALVVPGSVAVKTQAEAEGLDRVFLQAGAEWREPGCSMCLAMNGDTVPPGKTAVSTSNRNFEGRQGAGARTMLASPATAAACAIAGKVADPRQYELKGEAA
ncbi:MAG: 3-isopropylmalate dehydratase large subunit [Xanthomonadales bacterium]|nr:3-isopropylmalate dehydratase large subunit [Xanthomonadales bacterium]